MAQLPWSDFVREMGDVLERQVDSLLSAASRKAAFKATRDDDVLRLTMEVSVGAAGLAGAADSTSAATLQSAEQDEALASLEAPRDAHVALTRRVEKAEQRRKALQASLKQAKLRINELQDVAQQSQAVERPEHHETVRELQQERIGRAAAEASLAILEREHAQVRRDLEHERERLATNEDDMAALGRLNSDLQSEIAELWRVLRDTHPGEPMSILLHAPPQESGRRQGVERVQAQIIDARERFKRRSHRWPIAI